MGVLQIQSVFANRVNLTTRQVICLMSENVGISVYYFVYSILPVSCWHFRFFRRTLTFLHAILDLFPLPAHLSLYLWKRSQPRCYPSTSRRFSLNFPFGLPASFSRHARRLLQIRTLCGRTLAQQSATSE